ncbi:DUF1963 domain-containing protein [Anabaena sphaerica FACHB-251]|uniref:DUF1963 domain-containing protein n=1 Tax=Anabaena sphaerica FACHB-251 TaxID=2692883 RepID=A0A926WJ68_9NOST|nr:YwqG family protein [Anabaena sphaerica]MBD2295561.1 DUF1963 domain-containing protein [Anabaena sphaerica FACHB-251]
MKCNKKFVWHSSYRTSIYLDDCTVLDGRELFQFSSEAEAEAFFDQCVQELLADGWREPSIANDEENKDFTLYQVYEMYLGLESRLDEFANATAKPYIEITAHSTTETTLWQSKFGGLPYFPKHLEYPTSPRGIPLNLLAQINFAETPKIEDLPEKGILQFYIETSEKTTYGLEDDPQLAQTTFRVIYFPEIDLNIDNLLNNFDFVPEFLGPLLEEECLALKFTAKSHPISVTDYQFNDFHKRYFSIFQQSNLTEAMKMSLEEMADDFIYEYSEKYEHLLKGHRLGGYPKFVQDDIRYFCMQEEGYDFLLFQMDSNDDHSIMWGDVGVGQFFIQPSALKRLDFSKVLYTYACS